MKDLSPAVRYALVNAALGMLVGILIWQTSSGEGYFVFPFAGAASAAVASWGAWRFFCGQPVTPSVGAVVRTGLVAGSVSHYLCWVLLAVGVNLCYFLTGDCVSSTGDPPVSILDMLGFGFMLSGVSLVVFGWLTMSLAVASAFALRALDVRRVAAVASALTSAPPSPP
jgi:hypothetical protein